MKHLVIMCGLPGAGKDTWIKKYISGYKRPIAVNRDDIRFMLVKPEEEYFSKENEVFSTWTKLIKNYLEGDEYDTVIANATHISTQSRAKLLRALGTSTKGVYITVVHVAASAEKAIEHNKNRAGTRSFVPEDAIRNMAKSKGFAKPTLEEGFDEIITVKEDSVFQIERR